MTEWERGTDGIDRAISVISGKFVADIERHEKAKFQKEGHFVPGMKDENGLRREWDGPLVFVGTIWQDVRDVQGQITGRNQVLRVLADSPDELDRLLQLAIKDSFFAWYSAQQLQASTFESYRKHVDEHNQFVAAYAGWTGMPENAASVSTATVASLLIEGQVKAARHNIDNLQKVVDECRAQFNELFDSRPWWSRILKRGTK